MSDAHPDRQRPLHLAVSLDGAGWHPAAWREPEARPGDLLDARYWTGLVAEAESGLLDFVTIPDEMRLQSQEPHGRGRSDVVTGRLDAVLLAARLAPLTSSIGLVPTATATHTEPFHLSKAVATLDYVSTGRAGIDVRVSTRTDEDAHLGRRTSPGGSAGWAPLTSRSEAYDEARDYVEVLRRLWDSWEDDAEIRDAATGRFLERAKVHYIDYEGRSFSVKGPSITPRPPQGQPLVTATARGNDPAALRLIATSADVGFLTPTDISHAADLVAAVRHEQHVAGRGEATLHLFADLAVVLEDSEPAAYERLRRLDALTDGSRSLEATLLAGTPPQLADLMAEWQEAGLTGFRLLPATLPHDLTQITRGLVPELGRRGLLRPSGTHGESGATLRGRLGLPHPANRYAAA